MAWQPRQESSARLRPVSKSWAVAGGSPGNTPPKSRAQYALRALISAGSSEPRYSSAMRLKTEGDTIFWASSKKPEIMMEPTRARSSQSCLRLSFWSMVAAQAARQGQGQAAEGQ